MPISLVLAWFLAGILLFIIELVLPGFIIFFFALGAWSVALVLYWVDLSASAQIAFFLGSSLVSLFVLRRYLRNVFHGKSRLEDDSANVVPGVATGVVIEAIHPPGEGRVRYGGSFWRATADEPVEKNTVVRILKQDNLVIHVQPLTGAKGN
jgi:inner membrane protein